MVTPLREVAVLSSRVDAGVLRARLGEINAVPCPGTRGTLVFVEPGSAGPNVDGSPTTVMLPVDTPPGGLEAWIVSTAARRFRVLEVGQAPPRPPGEGGNRGDGAGGTVDVLHVLETGAWMADPPRPIEPGTSFGVLLVKPGVRATPAFLAELLERVHECGYQVVEARMISPEDVRSRGLARLHYRSHCTAAESGGLGPRERAALLRIYGSPAFEARFGTPAREVPVMPVERFIAEWGVPRHVIREWSDRTTAARGLDGGQWDGPNELSDDLYVNLFSDVRWSPRGPVVLVNPHMPSVLHWWESSSTPRAALLLAPAHPGALSWARLRSEFCGRSDGAVARPGSVRRDALEGVLEVPVEPGQPVDRTRNVVHLSNGPVEAVREAWVWFGRSPDVEPASADLLRGAGVTASRLLESPLLSLGGETRPVTTATAGLSMQEAAELLRRGRLVSSDEMACPEPTRRRIDAAHALIAELAADAPLRLVLVTGSTARGRATPDSDVDVLVVAGTSTEHRIERRTWGGLLLECEWMDLERARHVAAGGDRRDLKGLREASRIGGGLAVFDPDGFAPELARVAAAVTPPHPDVVQQLDAVVEALEGLRTSGDHPAFLRWEALRGIHDALSVLLLSLHPLRYQKPKWVLADLVDAGHGDLAAALVRSYGVPDDPRQAGTDLAAAHGILERIAAAGGLPSVDAVQAKGFASEFPAWSYACRTWLDARGLLEAGDIPAAGYTARFAVRLGLGVDHDGAGVDPRGDAPSSESAVHRIAAYRALMHPELEPPPPPHREIDRCRRWIEEVRRRGGLESPEWARKIWIADGRGGVIE